MATSLTDSINILMSQFKFEIDTDSLNKNIICTLCNKIMIDAYQTYCGCNYCRGCIVAFLEEENKYCLGGKEECNEERLVLESNVALSPRLNKTILKAKVHCPNKPCPCIIELIKIEEHLRVCTLQSMECPFSLIGCTNDEDSTENVLVHLRDDTLTHSHLLMECIQNLKNEVNGLKEDFAMSKLEQSREKEVQMGEMRREMTEEHRKIVEEYKLEMTNQKRETNKLKREIERLKIECDKRKIVVESVKKEMAIMREYSRNIKNIVETSERESTKSRDETRSTLTKMKAETDKKESAATVTQTMNDVRVDKLAEIMPNTIPCASLYVGDLHPGVTEAILYEKFQVHGNVLSIRVCRDQVTRKSLSYAYVNYQTSTEAKNAMENLNFDNVHGRPCRIMWSQRDPATRRSGVASIFIKNLDATITVKEINDTFAIFGEITSCKVQYDENGASKGFAFVNFMVEDDAEKAIQAINGKIIRDKIVYVAKFVPRNQRAAAHKDFTNCYVKNFANYLDESSMTDLFGTFGEIVSAKVMVDREGVSKGFGFVSFREHEEAIKAVNSLNGHVVNDKTIFVGRAMKKSERQRELKSRYEKTRQERLQQHKSGVNLYIKNLGNEITDDRLRQEFVVFGNITSAKVMVNRENGISKGFGFVCFSAPDEATRAVSEMNGKIVEGKPLYVALAQKKEDRVAHLRSQFQQRLSQAQPPFINPSQLNFMMNPQGARPFMPRPGMNMQPRWPANMYANMQPRNNMMQMPPQQNIIMSGMPQQRGVPQRNVMIDPMMTQQRSARPITGNVQMSQARPQYNMVANTTRPGNAIPYPYIAEGAEMKLEADVGQIDLNTTSKIANADTMEAKQLLGEKIYPLVLKHAGDMAGKITGMFLELDNAELLYMIENEESLRMKIEEAMAVLNVHKSEPVPHPQ